MSELKTQKVRQNLYDLLTCWYSEYYSGEEDDELYKELEESVDIAVEALDMIEQEQYYKDLAQSYEKTINKLTRAIAEQEPKTDILDLIRSEIKAIPTAIRGEDHMTYIFVEEFKKEVLRIIDKYKEV